MAREKVLLLDADTLFRWVFREPGFPPVVAQEDLVPGTIVYTPFFAVVHLYERARLMADSQQGKGSAEDAKQWLARVNLEIERLLSKSVILLHANESISTRWVQMGSGSGHLDSTLDNVWLVACALDLKQRKMEVTIATENPRVYRHFQDAMLLTGIHILERGWEDIWPNTPPNF